MSARGKRAGGAAPRPEPSDAPPAPIAGAGLNALAIDTTSDVLSLALHKAGRPAGSVYDAIGRRTTQEILPRIDALLRGAGLAPEALDVLVVARGPGSFTGTRIGLAVALTMARVTGRPLVGVDTLQLLAAQGAPKEGSVFHALLNCARDEVYHARFTWRAGLPVMEGEIALRRIGTVAPEIGEAPVVLRRFAPPASGTQPGAEAAFAALRPLPLRHPRPDGERLLTLGLSRFLADPHGSWAPVAPIYLKSEAFRTWRPGP